MYSSTVIITGSRDYYDWELIFDAINDLGVPPLLLMLKFGDCPTGADLFAYMYAEATRANFRRFIADWNQHGRAAGPIRNHEMVDSGADLVLGFPVDSSRGTRDCCEYAFKKGIAVRFPEMEAVGPPRKEWWKWAAKLS